MVARPRMHSRNRQPSKPRWKLVGAAFDYSKASLSPLNLPPFSLGPVASLPGFASGFLAGVVCARDRKKNLHGLRRDRVLLDTRSRVYPP